MFKMLKNRSLDLISSIITSTQVSATEPLIVKMILQWIPGVLVSIQIFWLELVQLIWFFKVISYFNSENVAVLQSYYVCIRIWIAIQYFIFYFYFLSSVFCGHFSVEAHICTENLFVICYWICWVLGNESVLCSRHVH